MVDTQHFCLRWNNYQSSITSAFENLRDDEDFVDVTLACDGRSLKAHRVVLSACSPYFRELLKSTPCKHPVIVLQDVAFNDLHALVEFIYHGEVNVHQRSLSSFLKTAEVLRVSGLTQQQAEETHNLAQIQSLGNSGARTPISHHPSFTDKMVEDALFPQGVSPPPHLNNLHSSNAHSGATVNQLLRRAAAAAALRRERNNSSQEELSLKRQRSDNGNNNSPDVISHMPQVTAADFSTIKHNNNNTPPMKDAERAEDYSSENPNNMSNNNASNGNGLSSSSTDKDSLTPSPPNRLNDNVKSEPMELVCSNHNLASDEQSNDSVGDHDIKYLGGNDGKGSLSSNNDDDIDNSIHSHTAPPFLLGENKLFSTPGSFNFSMAALAADPNTLAGLNHLQSAAELAGSPQGGAVVSPSSIVNCNNGGGVLSGNNAGTGRLSLPLPLTACHRCDVCGKLLSTKLTLKRHKEQQHLQPLNNAVCNLCHKVFRTLNSLNNHKSIYHRRQKQHNSHHGHGGSGGGVGVGIGTGHSRHSPPTQSHADPHRQHQQQPQHHSNIIHSLTNSQSQSDLSKPCIDFL
ncbi:broad-complex core protein isoforms 1/2/3/4/5 isoform X2 [Sitodiplosis mosellana]|uniref:broad-complex core protein isoforms 1/2/3/4/5 isoform X2 n=1 Tax=Sitodiplosis mosellana TaxID=263140 RepID=UPI00244381DA|nr:broad-complex core protein isoforms 1/2/3/4/5 isoform X2 [Sitodiplosis mosellana]XP_055296627.1 broad-complex core protein isoforms 1/2/3/4/5 isoform X2 [Sitodiplosis mosellana]XP_055296628.1 broad-complex core protein isoforms 1/2/3/4/5 isoform X2 [Sitodiplosis mosellana]XP_055296629.1 broad-complex core protein isoforms 1/2/3/4/5 isoform X2 [Sitodiplosis mosellana]XP_055296630.1 broad-complex core protein isoforms 1/2/3/4/5 isoform X2 [Sitodiplosis mosellana]XP_055296632.1 broad-complex c